MILSIEAPFATISLTMLCMTTLCHFAECHILFIVVLIVIMLGVILWLCDNHFVYKYFALDRNKSVLNWTQECQLH